MADKAIIDATLLTLLSGNEFFPIGVTGGSTAYRVNADLMGARAGVTRLSAACNPADTSITVAGTCPYVAGSLWAIIDAYTSQCEVRRVSSVSGNTLTLASALTYAHASLDNVLLTDSPVVSPVWWGAKAFDSTAGVMTANLAAFNAALAVDFRAGEYASGVKVVIPSGDWYINGSINATDRQDFELCGMGTGSRILSYASDKIALDLTGSFLYHIHDFEINGATSARPTVGILVARSTTVGGSNGGAGKIDSVKIYGYYDQGGMVTIANDCGNYDDLDVFCTEANFAIAMMGDNELSLASDYTTIQTAVRSGIDSWYRGCNFTTGSGGNSDGIRIYRGVGSYGIRDCYVTAYGTGTAAVHWWVKDLGDGNASNMGVIFENVQHEGTAGLPTFKLETGGGTTPTVREIQIHHAGGGANPLVVDDGTITYEHCHIQYGWTSSVAPIDIHNFYYGYIGIPSFASAADLHIDNPTGSTYDLWEYQTLTGYSPNAPKISINYYGANSPKWLLPGLKVGRHDQDESGYLAYVTHILKGTATFNPGSLNDGASATCTVTVSAAAVGDPVVGIGYRMAVSNVDETGGWQISGRLSGWQTVTVTLTNHTGSTKDLDSNTLTVLVAKLG